MKKAELTMIIEKGENGWWVGQIQEYPAAISQGKTIAELKDNLIDALKLLLEVQNERIDKDYKNRKVIKRKLLFSE
jgi:predicted RNase H-like HicB family nuclease